jgi:uncharacterized protein (DUF305 family)
VLLALAGCASRGRTVAPVVSGRPAYTEADVRFMTGMIGHHAQAILIAGWAEPAGASPTIRGLCARIIVSQRDEIAAMQGWLRDRGLPVPDAEAMHHMALGMDHEPMPGMLTPPQLMRLDNARGAVFDSLFLVSMIQHHEGAVLMVERLMAAHGAAQDNDVFLMAADINADQLAEIERMQLMLAELPSGGRRP